MLLPFLGHYVCENFVAPHQELEMISVLALSHAFTDTGESQSYIDRLGLKIFLSFNT